MEWKNLQCERLQGRDDLPEDNWDRLSIFRATYYYYADTTETWIHFRIVPIVPGLEGENECGVFLNCSVNVAI